MPVKTCLSALAGGSLGGLLGALIGIPVGLRMAMGGPTNDNLVLCVPMVGCGLGGVVGAPIGTAIDMADNKRILADHWDRVNDLVRRVNRAVAAAPRG